MLYEFAFTPDVFDGQALGDRALEVTLVELLKHLELNGMVANFHDGAWEHQVAEQLCSDASPDVRPKITRWLNHLKDLHRLAVYPRQGMASPDSATGWLEPIIETKQNLHQVVLGATAGRDYHERDPRLIHIWQNEHFLDLDKDCRFVELESVLDSDLWIASSRRQTELIRMCEADYRKHLTPVIRHARSVDLIDPWLDYKKSRFTRTLEVLAELLATSGNARTIRRIRFHTARPRKNPNEEGRYYDQRIDKWETDWEDYILWLQEDYRLSDRLEVLIWDRKGFGGYRRHHDRFIMTDQCGIAIQGGLDCNSADSADETSWNLLTNDARGAILDSFDPTTEQRKLYRHLKSN